MRINSTQVKMHFHNCVCACMCVGFILQVPPFVASKMPQKRNRIHVTLDFIFLSWFVYTLRNICIYIIVYNAHAAAISMFCCYCCCWARGEQNHFYWMHMLRKFIMIYTFGICMSVCVCVNDERGYGRNYFLVQAAKHRPMFMLYVKWDTNTNVSHSYSLKIVDCHTEYGCVALIFM